MRRAIASRSMSSSAGRFEAKAALDHPVGSSINCPHERTVASPSATHEVRGSSIASWVTAATRRRRVRGRSRTIAQRCRRVRAGSSIRYALARTDTSTVSGGASPRTVRAARARIEPAGIQNDSAHLGPTLAGAPTDGACETVVE